MDLLDLGEVGDAVWFIAVSVLIMDSLVVSGISVEDAWKETKS